MNHQSNCDMFLVCPSSCPPLPDVSADMDCVELPGDSEQAYPSCCPVLKCIQKSVENDILNY